MDKLTKLQRGVTAELARSILDNDDPRVLRGLVDQFRRELPLAIADFEKKFAQTIEPPDVDLSAVGYGLSGRFLRWVLKECS
jgi:hypothetical protein